MTLIDLMPIFNFLGSFLGGPANALIIVLAIAKIGLILAHVLGIIPLIIWAERKVIAWVQDRPGPNRVGPFGLLQGIADGLKLFMKEDFIPAGADRTLYLLGPALVIVPAFVALCIVPFGPVIEGRVLLDALTLFGLQGIYAPNFTVPLAITNPNIGVLFVFAVTSVGVYGITMAGWSSENKWSLLGGIRASAQMISYEISLSLSIIGVLLLAGSLNMYDIIDGQARPWQWNIIAQPVAFILFVISMFAETNRLPFDLAEGEAELTGGFHTEYSSMKFAMFFLGEYVNMITVSAVCSTLFLGGYHLIPSEWAAAAVSAVLEFLSSSQMGLNYPSTLPFLIAYLLAPLGLILKIAAFIFIFIMARACYPRLRYDQVMNLGWKIMLPVGLINLLLTAIGVAVLSSIGAAKAGPNATSLEVNTAISSAITNWKWVIGVVTGLLLVVAEASYRGMRVRQLKKNYRHYDNRASARAAA